MRAKVDLILVTGGSNWIRAAKNATKTIPIVMVNSLLDTVEDGPVESLARPGGNITGLTLLSRDLAGKRLQVLKEASTKVVRVAVVYGPASPGTAREVRGTTRRGACAGIERSVLGSSSCGGFR